MTREEAIAQYGAPNRLGHVTRFSWDASTYDAVCVLCGAMDGVPMGYHGNAFYEPCPVKEGSAEQKPK